MQAYYVEYLVNGMWENPKGICVPARNKKEAYDIATYEMIPEIEGTIPYSSWVASVTYNNGNYKKFNTYSGLPY